MFCGAFLSLVRPNGQTSAQRKVVTAALQTINDELEKYKRGYFLDLPEELQLAFSECIVFVVRSKDVKVPAKAAKKRGRARLRDEDKGLNLDEDTTPRRLRT